MSKKKIRLKEDFWVARGFFSDEDPEGESFTIVDKKEGELLHFYVDDETEVAVTDLEKLHLRNEILYRSIKSGEDKYIRIDEKGVTIDEQIEIMKKYNLMPEKGFPSDKELKEAKKHGLR